jgi:hypothetical protein
MNCKMKGWKIGILVVVGVAARGWVVMSLWNWLLPELFGIREIGYLQAMGVLLLSKILFGGFRGHCTDHSKWNQSRLDNMTPEEREKLKSGMSGCCGGKHKAEEAENKE